VGKAASAISPGVAKPVIAVVRETLVARPVRTVAVVEDAVGQGMFQNFPILGWCSDSLGSGTIARWLAISLGVAQTAASALGVLLLSNAPIRITSFAPERTSVAVRPPSPQ